MMIEREDVQAVLRRWCPEAPGDTIDSATSQIVGLSDEWVEVTSKEEEMGYHYSPRCPNICYLADQVDRGAELRLFLRRAVRDAGSVDCAATGSKPSECVRGLMDVLASGVAPELPNVGSSADRGHPALDPGVWSREPVAAPTCHRPGEPPHLTSGAVAEKNSWFLIRR